MNQKDIISTKTSNINLADARLGASILQVSDEWFAEARRMLLPSEPVWKEDLYDDNGKWMDGWESRRKRTPGHDWAVIALGTPGHIDSVDIDTRYFTGNYSPAASIEACYCPEGEEPNEETCWHEILPKVELVGDSGNLHEISDPLVWSHLRLNIFPDGGVARLRVYGEPYRDWSTQSANEQVDLAAAIYGAKALVCSDEHYGLTSNILNPGRAATMADGWETARRRGPGHDWVVIALAHPGKIHEVVVDTLHYKGNYPDSCSIQAANLTTTDNIDFVADSQKWEELLPPQKLDMDREHTYVDQLNDSGVITHVRYNMYPDGGTSRLRLYGYIAAENIPA